MNAYTEIRMKLDAGQRHFDHALVRRLLNEHAVIRAANAALRLGANISYIGGYSVETENGTEMCEPVPVVTVRR